MKSLPSNSSDKDGILNFKKDDSLKLNKNRLASESRVTFKTLKIDQAELDQAEHFHGERKNPHAR